MENIQSFREETRQRLNAIAGELTKELNDLLAQGVITQLDRQKLLLDANESGKAVINALDRTDIPFEMQKELVYRLVLQFETSAKDILNQAKGRLYNPRTLENRFTKIEREVASKHGPIVEKWITSNPQVLKQLHGYYFKRITEITRSKTPNYTEVEGLFSQFEAQVNNLCQSQQPKLNDNRVDVVDGFGNQPNKQRTDTYGPPPGRPNTAQRPADQQNPYQNASTSDGVGRNQPGYYHKAGDEPKKKWNDEPNEKRRRRWFFILVPIFGVAICLGGIFLQVFSRALKVLLPFLHLP